MTDPFAYMLFLMIAGHALADRPLQEGAIRAEKYAPRSHGDRRWLSGIAAHALIHGGVVCLVTGMWQLGVAETISHAAIDEAKLRGWFGQFTDQALHMACKIAWALIAVAAVAP